MVLAHQTSQLGLKTVCGTSCSDWLSPLVAESVDSLLYDTPNFQKEAKHQFTYMHIICDHT